MRRCGRARRAWPVWRRARWGSSTSRRSWTCAETSSIRASWIRSFSRRSRTTAIRATPTASRRGFGSFYERVQVASQSVARILHDAGVSFGLLYEGERNSGNDFRRIGEAGLFEMLVEQNMSVLADAQFEAIFTTDPHSLNALRNEYPRFGLSVPVYHYTELLADLVAKGAISLRTPLSGTRVTYHDPCYLARYNRITEAPRQLIEATGAELVEMPRNGTNTFCCGAGGGRIWMSDDDETSERPSEQRIREAQTLGDLDYFLVSCPKDLSMYSDAAKVVGADFEVAELTALIEQALAQAAPA